MKKIKIALMVVCLVAATWTTLALTGAGEKQEIAYINNQQVYDGFGLTKDLLKQYSDVFSQRKTALDSLEAKLAGLTKKIELEEGKNKDDLSKVTVMQEEYIMRKRRLEEEQQALNQQYQSQILSQMNEYLEAFGKEKKLKLLLGANGNGEIMYADASVDLTKEAIAFINAKYAGKSR